MIHKPSFKKAMQILLLAFFVFFTLNSKAEPLLTLIIDDIGTQLSNGKQALSLPGDITYALLPFSKHASELAKIGLDLNKEFILHSPMQSIDNRLINEQTLHIHMTNKQFKQQLNKQLTIFPFIKGLNNHMGSLLTTHPAYMKLVMQELKRNNLFFIDSRTTTKTIASKIALENNIPTVERDIFLDTDQSFISMRKQFTSAINLAKKNGHAVVIAHPYTNTLKFLQTHIPKLIHSNIKLVSASTLIESLSDNSHEKSTNTTSAGLRRTRSHYNN